ncbi:MAG: pilus assembly protein TadG-related protein [Angustibacter sp.]
MREPIGPRMTAVHRDDEGQIALPLVVFVLVVFAVALGMFGFGEASDTRGQAQKGADAAALAAAAAARDVVPLTIRTDPDSYYALTAGIEQVVQLGVGPAKGCAEAYGWAARNHTATTCRYEGRGRFHTQATSRPSAERQLVAGAEATADAHLPTCTVQIVVDTLGDRHATFTCVPGPRGGHGTAIAYYLNEKYVSSSPDAVWKALFRVRLVE